jgi:hypothetical protein
MHGTAAMPVKGTMRKYTSKKGTLTALFPMKTLMGRAF